MRRPSTWFVLALLAAAPSAQTLLRTFDGVEVNARLGSGLAGVGDVDADGFDDVAVGAPRAGFNAGAAWVYSGADGSELHDLVGTQAFVFFGQDIAPAGDLDADGHADFVVASPYDQAAGTATVFSGADGTVLAQQVGMFVDDYFSGAVDGGQDVDRDGVADLVVSAPWDKQVFFYAGAVSVFSGADGSLLHDWFGDQFNDFLGRAARFAGDLDDDGVPDVVGGGDTPTGEGYVRAWSGADGSVLHQFAGQVFQGFVGSAVDGVGDVNGDGFDDFAVGAYAGDDAESLPGFVHVISGADGSVLHAWEGDDPADWFGISVAGPGDVNGDGYADVLVGASRDDDGGENAGSATLFSGLDGSVLLRLDGAAGDELGLRVAGAGDVDGDGLPEVVVGAPRSDTGAVDGGSAYVIDYDGPTGPWRDLGHGLDGSLLAPRLRGIGPLEGREPWALDLWGALPETPVLLLWGTSTVDLPFYGGVLVPNFLPPGGIEPLVTDATGGVRLDLLWPEDAAPGLTLVFQVWSPDAGGPLGASASNAISGTSPR